MAQYNPLEDGVTHLNLYSKANTELGRFCSNFAKCPIETEDGHFDSIEGYWSWLSISEENENREKFRHLFGIQAKKYKDILYKEGDPGRFDESFQEKIHKAIHLKFQTPLAQKYLNQYKEMLKLPICHYYYYGQPDNAKVIDVTDDYPEFINSIKEEFQNYLNQESNKNQNNEQISSLFGINKGIICQQVNCQNVMGAGLAKAIMDQYPIVYETYCNSFQNETKDYLFLFGKVSIIPIGQDLYVANIYSQFDYGNPSKTGKIYTDADKLVKAVDMICKKYSNLPIYLPRSSSKEIGNNDGIGCGLGGESWDKLSQMFINLNKNNLHLLDTKNGIIHELEENYNHEIENELEERV